MNNVKPLDITGVPSDRGTCDWAARPPVGNILGDRLQIVDHNYSTYTWTGAEWTGGSAAYSTDSSGNVTGLVGPGGKNALMAIGPSPYLSNVIGHYLPGLNINTGSTAGRTFCIKQALPADFDAVQIVLHHHEGVSNSVYSACVAVTETADSSTDSNKYRSIVNATEQNTLDSTADQYGWRSVKWAGAATTTPAAAASATQPVVVFSDWIELSSVPRTDGGTLPLIMVRSNVQTGTSSFWAGAVAGETATAANGGFINQSTFFTDAGGTYVSAPQSNHPTASFTQNHSAIGFRIRSRKRGITLMCIGDSITQCKLTTADHASNWGLRAAAAIITRGIPCGSINYGISSNNTDRYWTDNAKTQMPLWKPTIAVMAAWTPNYGSYTTDAVTRYSVQRQAAMTADFVSTCIANGITPALANGVPCSSATIPAASQDAIRLSYVARIAASSASGTILLDWNGIINDGATPNRIPVALQYDTIHPNEAGIALQATQLANAVLARCG